MHVQSMEARVPPTRVWWSACPDGSELFWHQMGAWGQYNRRQMGLMLLLMGVEPQTTQQVCKSHLCGPNNTCPTIKQSHEGKFPPWERKWGCSKIILRHCNNPRVVKGGRSRSLLQTTPHLAHSLTDGLLGSPHRTGAGRQPTPALCGDTTKHDVPHRGSSGEQAGQPLSLPQEAVMGVLSYAYSDQNPLHIVQWSSCWVAAFRVPLWGLCSPPASWDHHWPTTRLVMLGLFLIAPPVHLRSAPYSRFTVRQVDILSLSYTVMKCSDQLPWQLLLFLLVKVVTWLRINWLWFLINDQKFSKAICWFCDDVID